MAERHDSTALYRAADRSTRRSGVRAALFAIVALVAAVGSALLLTRYMDARTAAARVPTTQVVVAAVDLPVGTEITPEKLRVIAWPAASVPEDSFQELAGLEGKMVATRVYKGEPIMPSLLTGSDSGKGLSALLPPGYRAAAVRVDDIVGVAGFIHPGDSVDVIVTMRSEGGTGAPAARVILQNIKVLAVGKDLDTPPATVEKVVPATVATLLVDAEQSERLALAATQGKLLLTLRGATDAAFVETRGVTPSALLAAPQPVSAPPPEPRTRIVQVIRPEPPRPTPTPTPGQVVEILRGDVFERRDFKREGDR